MGGRGSSSGITGGGGTPQITKTHMQQKHQTREILLRILCLTRTQQRILLAMK